ncbi:MAG: SGNH/GDSL hydrolase family protein [archaeon]
MDSHIKERRAYRQRKSVNILILATVILAFLLVAELVSRNVHESASQIVRLSSEVHPTYANYVISRDRELIYEGTYRYNRYLNPDNIGRLRAKPEGVYRILVVGDSVAASFINGIHQYFSEELEQRLNAQTDRKIEVINSAVGGYNIVQESRYLEIRGLQTNPDMILLVLCKNDFDWLSAAIENPDETTQIISYKRSVPRIFSNRLDRYLIMRSAFYRFSTGMALRIAEKAGISVQSEELLFSQEKNREALQKIIDLSRRHGTELVIVIFPSLDDFEHYPNFDFHDQIRDVASDGQVPVVDLYSSFSRYSHLALRLSPDDDTHPNKLGYDIAVEQIQEFIRGSQLLK